MSKTKALLPTPPRLPPSTHIDECPETPGPTRARIDYLQKQTSELVRQNHNLTRKHTKETTEYETTIMNLRNQLRGAERWKQHGEGMSRELERVKMESEGLRQELELCSVIAQQKLILAQATEAMQLVEMEQRFVQAETARQIRDHKLALSQAKQDDMAAELEEKDAQLVDLEAALAEANTSLEHQRAAQTKADKLQQSSSSTQKELEEAQSEIQSLHTKVEGLESRVKQLKEREKSLKAELDSALDNDEGKGSDKEKRELQKALRDAKSELSKKATELLDVNEELSGLRETSKEREKALKLKIREAIAERDRLVGIEEELESLRSSKATASRNASPKKTDKVVKPKARKSTPSDESDEEVVPKKKVKKAISSPRKVEKPKAKVPVSDDEESDTPYKSPKKGAKKPASAPLRETSDNDKTSKRKSPESKAKSQTSDNDVGGEKKKKKRVLGGLKGTFDWDPILQSGDGVIPMYLSPVNPGGKTVKGTIPRLGFPSQSSSGSLRRIG